MTLNAAAAAADGGCKHRWGPAEELAVTVDPKRSCCNERSAQARGLSAVSDGTLRQTQNPSISNWN